MSWLIIFMERGSNHGCVSPQEAYPSWASNVGHGGNTSSMGETDNMAIDFGFKLEESHR